MTSKTDSNLGIGNVSLLIAILIVLACKYDLTFPLDSGVAVTLETQSCGL